MGPAARTPRIARQHVILSVTLWNRTDTSFVLLPPPDVHPGSRPSRTEDEALVELISSLNRMETRVLGIWIETDAKKSDQLRLGSTVTNVSYILLPVQIIGHFVVTSTDSQIDDEDIYGAVGIEVSEDPKAPPPPLIIRATKSRPVSLTDAEPNP